MNVLPVQAVSPSFTLLALLELDYSGKYLTNKNINSTIPGC